jgi:hypothetical protein
MSTKKKKGINLMELQIIKAFNWTGKTVITYLYDVLLIGEK